MPSEPSGRIAPRLDYRSSPLILSLSWSCCIYNVAAGHGKSGRCRRTRFNVSQSMFAPHCPLMQHWTLVCCVWHSPPSYKFNLLILQRAWGRRVWPGPASIWKRIPWWPFVGAARRGWTWKSQVIGALLLIYCRFWSASKLRSAFFIIPKELISYIIL